MRSQLAWIFAAVLGLGGLQAERARGTEYQLYYLGGQSNMDGHGRVDDLPRELSGELEGVRIFCGNAGVDGGQLDGRGVWKPLTPGYGYGFSSDGTTVTLGQLFGPELSFGQRLHTAKPDRKFAIIKYCRGGTALASDVPLAKQHGCWDPDFSAGDEEGVNQFDHFETTISNAFSIKDIDGDGTEDKLIPAGIAWMQGESDTFVESSAKQYEANLKKLMTRMRETRVKASGVSAQTILVAIGRIADSGRAPDGKVMEFGGPVQNAQAAFVKNDERAVLIDATSQYDFCDEWHFDSAGYLDLGRQFADALLKVDR